MSHSVSAVLKYANLQMAAEALYDFDPKKQTQSDTSPGQVETYPSNQRKQSKGPGSISF